MKKITIEGKRPADASPAKALELSRTLSGADIAKLWGISRQRVSQLIAKAKAEHQAEVLAKAHRQAAENEFTPDSSSD